MTKEKIHVYTGFSERTVNGDLFVFYQRETKFGFTSVKDALSGISPDIKGKNSSTWLGTYDKPGAMKKGIHKKKS